jgi:hypothetical protein
MVQITKTDGSVVEMAGSMSDKLFARLAKTQGWASYKETIMTREQALAKMSDKDREAKAYYDSKARTEKALNF